MAVQVRMTAEVVVISLYSKTAAGRRKSLAIGHKTQPEIGSYPIDEQPTFFVSSKNIHS
jgi:hypothetical protein